MTRRTDRLLLCPLLVALHQQQAALAYNIAIVPKNLASEGFFGLARRGCEEATAAIPDFGCSYNGTLEADVEGTIAILEALVDDDSVGAIAVSVLDPEAYTPVINRGIAEGKPILTFDSDAPNSDRLAYIGTDNYEMGRELAKLLQQIQPTGGKYGMLSGIGENLAERVRGVRDALDETDWVIVDEVPKNGQESIDISLLKLYELVEEYPEINSIVSVTGTPMFGDTPDNWKDFVDSNPDVLTIIADTLPIQLDLIKASYVDALVGQLPYNMGYQVALTIIEIIEKVSNGVPLQDSLPTDLIFGTHQLEVLRIPLQLPAIDFNYNQIGNVAIVGYILCAIIVLSSIGLTVWIWWYRTNQVVIAGQPIFLMMICFGTLLMGSAIIPLSIDDETGQRAADIACMCAPWLINVGFTVAFSALFSKTWRLNRILLSRNRFQRVKVTEKDVMLPFAILLTMNIISLACWTAIAPLEFVRTNKQGTDPWNRPIGSYGQCKSTSGAAGNSIPYLVVIAVVNVTALVVANFESYRARNVLTEFNESSYIAMANASFLQAIVVCVPITFLTRENPQAYFVVLSVVLFIISGAILGFIFVPKMLSLKEGKRHATVTVTGVHAPGALRRTRDSSHGHGEGDPVEALLQKFRHLSWEDKTAVLKKLSPSGEEVLGIPENVGTHPIDDKDERRIDAPSVERTVAAISGFSEMTETEVAQPIDEYSI